VALLSGGFLLVRRQRRRKAAAEKDSSGGWKGSIGSGDPLRAYAEAAAYHAGMNVPRATPTGASGIGSAETSSNAYGPYGTLGGVESKSEAEEHDGSPRRSQGSWRSSQASDRSFDEGLDEEAPPPPVDKQAAAKGSRWGLVRARRVSLAGLSKMPTVELLLDELEFQVMPVLLVFVVARLFFLF
jgi:hypothetical protein